MLWPFTLHITGLLGADYKTLQLLLTVLISEYNVLCGCRLVTDTDTAVADPDVEQVQYKTIECNSCKVITDGLCFAGFAYVLYYAYKNGPLLNRQQRIRMYITNGLLGTCKCFYIVHCYSYSLIQTPFTCHMSQTCYLVSARFTSLFLRVPRVTAR